MYIAIAIVLYVGFAILVGRFCSLNSRWERAVGDLPKSGNHRVGGLPPEGVPLSWPEGRECVEAEAGAGASSNNQREETPVGAAT